MTLIDPLFAIKQLLIAHVVALTFTDVLLGNGGTVTIAPSTDHHVSCKDGWTTEMSGDPEVNIVWYKGRVDLWAGSGWQDNEIYLPIFWVRSRDENLANICRRAIKKLWVPGSANAQALNSAGVNGYLVPKDTYPSNTVGGTLETIQVGQQFEMKLRDTT